MDIRDWTVALEIDVHAAAYIRVEETKQEVAREKRDRDFWRAMFGDKSASEEIEESTLEEVKFGTR
jgi:hypothetical protein